MKNIFLSAGIPDIGRGEKYISTADFIAIRDAIRALVALLLPKRKLIYGGQPAITKLIRETLSNLKQSQTDQIVLYQSDFFKEIFPSENTDFVQTIYAKEKNTRQESLTSMRTSMIKSTEYDAGIFIGGMEGVEEEYQIFQENHPKAMVIPVVNTGAAAALIYDSSKTITFGPDIETAGYFSLFKKLLGL